MNHTPTALRRTSPWRRVAATLSAALIVVALTACTGAPAAPLTPVAATPTSQPAPTAPATLASTEEGPLTLVWWTPEFLSPQAPQPAGPEIERQLREFSASRGGEVQVEAVRKSRYGKGGLLDSLRTAQPVAPASLPDIVALDVVELEKAVQEGLLQPLDELFNDGVTENLYAFATEAGRFDGNLYAIQYIADVDHGAYQTQQVAQPPASWTDVIERRIAYLFPLASPQGGGSARPAENLSHAVLGQYLSAGATLGSERQLALEAQPLLRMLTFYEEAVSAGVLPPAALELSDGEEVWSVFSQGQAPMAYVSARRYSTDNESLNAGYSAAPGLSGGATSIAGGWALAIVTRDPRRQVAAAELIAWLLRPENAGAWARAGGWLPTSDGALELIGSDAYARFLDEQLAITRSVPIGPEYAATAAQIQAAIVAVVQGESDAASATEAAVNGQQ